MTLLLPSCPDSRRSRCPPLPFRQSLSRIGYSFSIFHVTQCRLEVIPLTVQLPLIPAFSPPPLRWLAPLVVHGVRSPMFFRSPSHCSACLSFAQHCSPFIERALLAAEACPRCHCRTVPVIHTHTLANTSPPCVGTPPWPQTYNQCEGTPPFGISLYAQPLLMSRIN